MLESSITVQALLEKTIDAIKSIVIENRIGIAFSGGVDSSLIAKLCSDLGYNVTLLTIGFPDSHDIEFAKKVNEYLKLSHKIYEIDAGTFHDIVKSIEEKIGRAKNLSWLENCIAFHYIAKLSQSNQLKVLVTANGIDELFCGYNVYRTVFNKGEKEILKVMDYKIENEVEMMRTVNEVTLENKVRIVHPLLSSESFVHYAKNIPISEKILGEDDLIRKHIIRRLASSVGVPQIAVAKRKKAMQYGSNIHRMLMKLNKG